jgi:hypothetical protein
VTTKLGGARVTGGTEDAGGARFSPPEARPLTRSELAAEERKKAEERIALPDGAVAADSAEMARERELRDRVARPGQAILPLVEGKPVNGPAAAAKPPGAGPNDPLDEILKGG